MNDYRMNMPRAAFGVAAVVLTAITLGLVIVAPAKTESAIPQSPALVAATPAASDARHGGDCPQPDRSDRRSRTRAAFVAASGKEGQAGLKTKVSPAPACPPDERVQKGRMP